MAGRVHVVCETGEVCIPTGLDTLAAYRRWTASDEFPEKLQSWYCRGSVGIDFTRQQLFSHVGLKGKLRCASRFLWILSFPSSCLGTPAGKLRFPSGSRLTPAARMRSRASRRAFPSWSLGTRA